MGKRGYSGGTILLYAAPEPDAPSPLANLLHLTKSTPIGLLGSVALIGVYDNDHPWHESVIGSSQEAWLLKQLYVEHKFGRRPRQGKGWKKAAR